MLTYYDKKYFFNIKIINKNIKISLKIVFILF
jgi:hypothetical protein